MEIYAATCEYCKKLKTNLEDHSEICGLKAQLTEARELIRGMLDHEAYSYEGPHEEWIERAKKFIKGE